MKLTEIIDVVLKEQEDSFLPVPVDIIISNGNILLRSFHIYELDLKKQLIKGMTHQEEYAHSREERDPVYCILKLDEIKELVCKDLELEFINRPSIVKV